MIDDDREAVDLHRLRSRLDEMRIAYAGAAPFSHIVVDDVLHPSAYESAVAEFPAIDDPSWAGYLHVNETKFANPRHETWGPTLRGIAEELCGDDFVEWLGGLTGFEGLKSDLSMDGGGLHQTLRGGHLNVHADFTTHHRHHHWRRRVNLLLYLNASWEPAWGGALELWDTDVRTCVRKVEPIGNRMLIFTTSGDAYHGHPDPLACPDGMARRSLALYYFTEEDRPVRRATRYRARPGDGAKGLAIWADRHVLSLYDSAKTKLGLSDRAVSAMLGRLYRLTRRLRGDR
jgi:2-oxoglutarate-Fe(II)-dependent oxygenase superfamily protein